MAPVIIRSDKPQAVAKPGLRGGRSPTVRLPEGTAELVNRMLAARCGSSRAEQASISK